MEAYINDVIIKSRVKEDLISDLSKTFTNLRRFRWKLNPEKCVFGVPSGKLLGFIMSYRGSMRDGSIPRRQVTRVVTWCTRASSASNYGTSWAAGSRSCSG